MSNVLDDTHAFVRSIVAQSPAITRVIVLASALSYCVDDLYFLPRIAFLSDDMRTGKTTAAKVAALLSSNPVKITRATTDPAVLSAFNTPARPTIFVEETSTIFGRDGRAERKPNLRLIVLDGCDRTAVAQVSRSGSVETFSIFCLVFAAGRGAGFPDDGRDRAVICPMRRASVETVPVDDQDAQSAGAIMAERLASWAKDGSATIGAMAREIGTNVHPDLVSRRRDVWAPLFAVAQYAGGDWPAYVLSAFRELALGNSVLAALTEDDRIRLAAGDFVRDTADLPARSDGRTILRSGAFRDHLRGIDAFRNFRDQTLAGMIVRALGDSTPFTIGGRDGTKVRGWDTTAVLALADHVSANLAAPREIASVAPAEDF